MSFSIIVTLFKFLYAKTKEKRKYSSIITNIYLFPEVVGSGPLKSRLILSNGLVALIKLKLSFDFKNLTLTLFAVGACFHDIFTSSIEKRQSFYFKVMKQFGCAWVAQCVVCPTILTKGAILMLQRC